MGLLLPALALVLAGGLLALLFSRRPLPATVCGVTGVAAGCALGLVSAVNALGSGGESSLRLDWDGAHGPFVVGLDDLSAFFLVPVFGLSALAAVYGGAYLYGYRG